MHQKYVLQKSIAIYQRYNQVRIKKNLKIWIKSEIGTKASN